MIEPAHRDGGFTLWCGEVREMLRQMPGDSVDCVATSPPYWSLRDYKLPPSTWGGDEACEHEWGDEIVQHVRGSIANEGFNERWDRASGDRKQERTQEQDVRQGRFCSRCGAWRGQLGLEPSPALFVEHLVEVFREVRRVLAPHGTVWLNLGDSYIARAKGSLNGQERSGLRTTETQENAPTGIDKTGAGIAPKNLAMVPARVAIALQDDGWIVRAEVVWSKENPMPESVTDRPSRAHEMVYMLTKQATYFFDQEAVREPHKPDGRKVTTRTAGTGSHENYDVFGHEEGRERWPNGGRNVRDVWTIPTQSFSAAWLGIDGDDHFAAFPEELVRRCIEASAPRWVCAHCGTPRYRIIERVGGPKGDHTKAGAERDDSDEAGRETGHGNRAGGSVLADRYKEHGYAEMRTLGWTECPCQVGEVICRTCDHSIPHATRNGQGEAGVQPGKVSPGQAGNGQVPDQEVPGAGVRQVVHGTADAGDVLPPLRGEEAGDGGEAPRLPEGRQAGELQGAVDHEGRLRDGLPPAGLAVPLDDLGSEPGDGAQARDGDVLGPPADEARGSASPEREAGRQPTAEPEAGGLGASRRKRLLSPLPGFVLHSLTCPGCGGGDLGWDGLPSDSFAPILSPTGDNEDELEDPSMETGRAGMNRPRNEGEGVRVMTRYEQRAYAEQLRRLAREAPGWFCAYDQAVGEETMAHYMRTDASGARAIPPGLLEEMIADGPVKRVVLPVVPPGEYRPGRVLDIFMGSGTTAQVARQLNREVWGTELNPAYVRIAAARAERYWKRPTAPRKPATGQASLLEEPEVAAPLAD